MNSRHLSTNGNCLDHHVHVPRLGRSVDGLRPNSDRVSLVRVNATPSRVVMSGQLVPSMLVNIMPGKGQRCLFQPGYGFEVAETSGAPDVCNFLSSCDRSLISSVVASRQDGGVKAQSSSICISVWFLSSHLLHLDSMQPQGAAGSVGIAKMTEGFANCREHAMSRSRHPAMELYYTVYYQ